MKRESYASELKELQRKLTLLQHAYVRDGRRGVLILEGWDAAGKGGLVRRLAWCLDPRKFRVWSTGAPDHRERNQHWMQRFWTRLPVSGEIAAFDRSWYGRVLVERVEGFATEAEWERAYEEIRAFEHSLVSEEFRIAKLFLDITPQTQLKRFRERFETPAKRWKLTEEDLRNRAKWDAYAEAYDDMIARCSPGEAPWVRIDANDKRRARIEAFKTILDIFGQGVDISEPEAPAAVIAFFDH